MIGTNQEVRTTKDGADGNDYNIITIDHVFKITAQIPFKFCGIILSLYFQLDKLLFHL